MVVSDLIAYSMRVAGVLGVGQQPLPQDSSDAQIALMQMMRQWRIKRWLVFRLDNVTFPVRPQQGNYTLGPSGGTPAADVVTSGNFRPASIESIYLRQNTGHGPNSYPVDYPMRRLRSRQEYDAISLKNLQSWPGAFYYDPTVPQGTLMIWPIPIQNFFSMYVAYNQAIDFAAEGAQNIDLLSLLPAETEEALIYNLALRLMINYKLPPDQGLAAAARATANTLRQANFQFRPLKMPTSISGSGRIKNPMMGFYPEAAVGVPYTVLS